MNKNNRILNIALFVSLLMGSSSVVVAQDVKDHDQIVKMIKEERPEYSIGSSVISISGEELRRTKHHDLSTALAGRVPGLVVTTTASLPGSETFGTNTRGNSASPLVLVDGIVGSLNTVNVFDVESVTFTKDASSSVFYGMQASGGILYVKTYRGKKNTEPQIKVDALYTIESQLNTPQVLGAADHVRLTTEAYANDNMSSSNQYTEAQIAGYAAGETSDLFPDNDWYNMFMADQVATYRVNASASGGGEYVNYYASIGYLNQGSPFIEQETVKPYGKDRFDIQSNIDIKVNDFIDGYATISTQVDKDVITAYSDGVTGIISSLLSLPPTEFGPLTPDGEVVVTASNLNPTYGNINKSGYKDQTITDFKSTFGLKFDLSAILDGLGARGEFRYYSLGTSTYTGSQSYARSIRDLTNDAELVYYSYQPAEYYDTPVSFTKSSGTTVRRDVDGELFYNKNFGDHNVNALAFVRHQYYNAASITGTQPVVRFGTGGKIGYGYKNIFFADYNFSYEGSEQFADGKKYGLFNTGSAALILSNMDFLKDNSVLTYLKLRGSYGVIGSDAFGDDRFIYTDYLDSTSWNSGINYLSAEYELLRLGNYDLTWEKSTISNVAVEFSLFDQISVTAEYFVNKGSDLLIDNNLTPLLYGVASDILPAINEGLTTNKGVEFQLGYSKKINEDVRVGATGYFTFTEKMTDYSGETPRSGYPYEYKTQGFRVGQNWGYQIDYSNGNGYFNTQDELDASPSYTGTSPRLGDFVYVDQNNDNVIDDKDMIPMGETTVPQVAYGLELYADFYGFDLSVLFQGLGKYGSFLTGVGYYENNSGGMFFDQHLTAWTAERYAAGETITAPALTMKGSSSQKANNYYYQDKSFCRLKNLEIGYTLPKHITKAIDIESLRVYGSGINLFTWDRLENENHDIEGTKITAYQTPRYITMGLTVTF
ncbi:MAG: SusC/RagA family TonB-linked outer membrane protein [Rikenellaceae bacterium]